MNHVAPDPALLLWPRERAGRSVESLSGRFPRPEGIFSLRTDFANNDRGCFRSRKQGSP
jgi:hypothetical protein